jgi:tRNA(Met) C34 N-acetyltransferase TmcA
LYEIDKQWQAISPELMLELLLPLSVNITDKLPKLSPSQLQMLHQFSVGNRSSTQCNFQLRTFILRHISNLSELNLDQQKLLIIAILQLRPTDQVAKVLKLTGKKQIEKKLKEAVNQLLKVTNN